MIIFVLGLIVLALEWLRADDDVSSEGRPACPTHDEVERQRLDA